MKKFLILLIVTLSACSPSKVDLNEFISGTLTAFPTRTPPPPTLTPAPTFTPRPTQTQYSPLHDVYDRCINLIRAALKSPTTATFPEFGKPGFDFYPKLSEENPWQFTIKSQVDAQNAFGAMIREEWFCNFDLDPDIRIVFVRMRESGTVYANPDVYD